MKRAVCLLLMPAVLLTQRASLVHSHGDSQPAGHALRPHFHTGPAPPRHDRQRHHHGPGGHHHHDKSDEAPEPAGAHPDHDSDAVFIVAFDAAAAGRSHAGEEAGCPALWVAGSNMLAGLVDSPPDQPAPWSRPPPSSASARPLYLRHLTLLL